jgi:site-specific DNA-cytosine methylase
MSRNIELPRNIKHWLDSWGPELLRKVRAGFNEGMEAPELRLNGVPMVSAQRAIPGTVIVLGTDCSGCEAPVWALRKIGVEHKHSFSSDCARAPQDVITANCMVPGFKLYDDMLKRSHDKLPAITHYVAGFPCKPFSMLRAHKTKLLKEPTAKPFFAVLDTLKARQPQVAVLENVSGMKRVLPLIHRFIQKLGMYDIHTVDLNPASMGEPVHRPRVYMILLRRDCVRSNAGYKEAAHILIRFMQEACMTTKQANLADRLLPKGHAEVKRATAAWKQTYQTASSRGFAVTGGAASAGSEKGCSMAQWQKQHTLFQQKQEKEIDGPGFIELSADDMLLHNPREREMWSLLAALTPSGEGGRNIIIDLSQSITRGGLRLDQARKAKSQSRMIMCVSVELWLL